MSDFEINNIETAGKSQEVPEENNPDYDLIAKKLLICRGVTTEQHGSPNVYRAAEILYASLYAPQELDTLVKPSDKFPDRLDILKKQIVALREQIPEKKQFIERVRHAMTNEVDFGKCLSEEAKDQFAKAMAKSEFTVIWTDGDMAGIPEKKFPGSKEQLKKIASAGFYNQERRKIAETKGIDHKDVMSVMAAEGKMKLIPMIVEEFVKKGITRIIIIEDRVKNITEAQKLIKESNSDMEVFPVWIRAGQYKNKIEPDKSLEQWEKEFHSIENISELEKVLSDNKVFENGVKVGSVFDLDGPLQNDDKRKEVQTQAVIEAIKNEGWI